MRAALATAALLLPPVLPTVAAQELLEPPPTSNPAPMGEAPNVLRPVPDVHGRAGQGTTEQHGNDTTSPGGGSTGVTGTGSSMGTGTDPDASEAMPTPGGAAVAPQGSMGGSTGGTESAGSQ